MKKILLVGVLVLTPLIQLNAAYQQAGLNDSTFGSSGVGTYNIAGIDEGKKIIQLPNGSYVLAGTYGGSTGAMLLFIDQAGTVTKTVSIPAATAVSGFAQSDNTLYLMVDASADSRVLAYDFSGNPVTTFGTNGYQDVTGTALNTSGGMLFANNSLYVLVDHGGNKIKSISASTGAAVSGFTTIDLAAFTTSVDAMAVYNGEIYVVGNETGPVTTVRKYNATTGAQVTTGFGTSGVATTGQAQVATGISVDQATGEIYVLYYGGAVSMIKVHKFKTDGTVDTSWASSGIYTDSSFGTATAIIAALGSVQYITGYSAINVGKVVRLKGGAADSTFGDAGSATNNLLTRVNGGLITGAGNKVVLVGNNSLDALLWRLTGSTGNSANNTITLNNQNENGSAMTGAPR